MMAKVIGLDQRLGLRTVLQDHVETWSLRTGSEGAHDRRSAALWYYLTPTALAVPFLYWKVGVNGVGQILSGVAVFTALLFGLLVLMFNTGIALRKDGASLANAHDLRRVITDIRANVTYAAVVALLLAVLVVVAAAGTPSTKALPWGWTPALVWISAHLVLNLLTILRRLRTAFNYITR
jgi:hypothetical protein